MSNAPPATGIWTWIEDRDLNTMLGAETTVCVEFETICNTVNLPMI